MFSVRLLSIPNYWLTYYIHGFFHHPLCKLALKPAKEFSSFNYTSRCVIKVTHQNQHRLIVLDPDDPNKNHFNYEPQFDHIFLSQKLKNTDYLPKEKFHSLPPHFPIRSFDIQKLMGLSWFAPFHIWQNFKQLIITSRLKSLHRITGATDVPVEKQYYFYQRSLWKNELNTNLLGITALNAFKEKGFTVAGGLFRSDGFRTGNEKIDSWVTDKKISNKAYIRNTKRSAFCFNSPAIRGACSWRVGEYLAMDKLILSSPFEVEIPAAIKFIEVSNVPEILAEQIAQLPADIHRQEFSNKDYWVKHVMPVPQIDFILSTCFPGIHT